MKRSFTTLTEATLITAVVQHGYGEIITDALLEVGIQGSTVHGGRYSRAIRRSWRSCRCRT